MSKKRKEQELSASEEAQGRAAVNSMSNDNVNIAYTHRILWITADGDETLEEERYEPTLEELNKFVGGYIESLRVTIDQVAIFNEDGRRDGLPVNPKASKIAGQTLLGNVAFVSVLAR